MGVPTLRRSRRHRRNRRCRNSIGSRGTCSLRTFRLWAATRRTCTECFRSPKSRAMSTTTRRREPQRSRCRTMPACRSHRECSGLAGRRADTAPQRRSRSTPPPMQQRRGRRALTTSQLTVARHPPRTRRHRRRPVRGSSSSTRARRIRVSVIRLRMRREPLRDAAPATSARRRCYPSDMARSEPTPDEARRARARARASWPIRRTTLDDDADDLSDTTTADERLAMMAHLARDAWASSGMPWPSYDRADMPGRVVRNGHGRSGA